jgi:hypothetical protein
MCLLSFGSFPFVLSHLVFCRLFENLCFLFGSAYFVSGSYPEGSEADDEDDDIEASNESTSSGSFFCWKSKTKPPVDTTVNANFTSPFLEKHNSNNGM